MQVREKGTQLTSVRRARRVIAHPAGGSLFAMMIERNAPDPLADRAEELVDAA